MDTNYDDMSVDEGGGGGNGGNFLKRLLKNKRFLLFVVIVTLCSITYFVLKSKFQTKKGNFVPLKEEEHNEEERDVENFIKSRPQRQPQQHAAPPPQQYAAPPPQQYAPPPQPAAPKVRESMDADGTMDGGFQGFGDVRGNSSNSFIKNLENKFANPGKRNIGN